MNRHFVHITVKGKWVDVPALYIGDKTVVCVGHWIKRAELYEEEWSPPGLPADLASFIATLKTQKPKADYFTFAQTVGDVKPRYPYHLDWDNAAAIGTHSYAEWWENHLPQVTRKNVRRSEKRGVSVRLMELNDATIGQIHQLYGQIQTKQGSQFAHFGKDFATVKRELSTFCERSQFIGAFHENALIGFIKLVFMGPVAGIMHIITRNEDYDKRPANALLARAVQVCEEKGLNHLVYGKYNYGNKTKSSLTEYKKRNGFSKVEFPRYFVPLTWRGEIVIRLRLYRGLLGILPSGVIHLLLSLRARLSQRLQWLVKGGARLEEQTQD